MILKTPKTRSALYTFIALEAPQAKKPKVQKIIVSDDDAVEEPSNYGEDEETNAEDDEVPEENEEEVVSDYGEDEETAPEDSSDTESEEEVVSDYGEDEETTSDEGEEETVSSYGDESEEEYSDEEVPLDEDNSSEDTTINDAKNYALYTSYMNLYNNLQSYSDTLNNMVVDDINANQVLVSATEKVNNLVSLLNEYMIIKFINESYENNLVFFNTVIATMKLILELLKNNKIYFKH